MQIFKEISYNCVEVEEVVIGGGRQKDIQRAYNTFTYGVKTYVITTENVISYSGFRCTFST